MQDDINLARGQGGRGGGHIEGGALRIQGGGHVEGGEHAEGGGHAKDINLVGGEQLV